LKAACAVRVTLDLRVLAFSVVHSLRALAALVVLQAPAAPTTAAPGDQTILWFRSADAPTIDARALLDAVAVYTRDLGLTVRAAAEPAPVPADARSARDAATALRAQAARLGFWCEMRPGADVAVLTVVGADAHLELHLVERTGAHEAELYRAIGLKLRSVLTGTAVPEPPPAPRAPPPAVPAPEPPATPPTIGARAEPATPSPARRPFLSLGYRFSSPVDDASPRHALAIDGALPLGRFVEIDAGTELAPRRADTVDTDTISIFDWPIIAGARVVRRSGRATLGGGLFAALHLLWASANGGDGMTQSAFTAAGGAGAELLGRLHLTGALAAELRVYAEVPVPTTHFSLRGHQAVDMGARAGAGLSLAFPAP
jgi:hypothetical protein